MDDAKIDPGGEGPAPQPRNSEGGGSLDVQRALPGRRITRGRAVEEGMESSRSGEFLDWLFGDRGDGDAEDNNGLAETKGKRGEGGSSGGRSRVRGSRTRRKKRMRERKGSKRWEMRAYGRRRGARAMVTRKRERRWINRKRRRNRRLETVEASSMSGASPG